MRFAWAPFIAETDPAIREANPLVQRDAFKGRGQRFIPWLKS
jgi:hypothetical protein